MIPRDERLRALDARAARAVRRVYISFTVLFALCAAAFTYWHVFAAPNLSESPLNPRLFARGEGVRRGAIFTADGKALAFSARAVTKDGQRSFERELDVFPTMMHTIGYKGAERGAVGLERAYDRELLGLADWALPGRIRDAWGARRPTGHSLVTTLRSEVQRAADVGLKGRRGAVVALEPRTGDVLAIASAPGIEPEALARPGDWERLRTARHAPLFNRALAGAYPPGSAIKFALLGLALDAGTVEPGERFVDRGSVTVDGYRIHNPDRAEHGTLSLDEALARSSNVVFVTLGERIGARRFVDGLRSIGFDERIPFDLSIAPSRVPDSSEVSAVTLAEMSIGQGPMLVTPVHMAALAAAIANDGVAPPLHIAGAWIDERDGTVRTARPPAGPERWFSRSAARRVTGAMTEVVKSGTGAAASIPGVIVAGKTGTAENPHGAEDAWFVGFAPAWDPKVAVAVVVEGGGSGGAAAAPIARRVMEAALRSQAG